MAEEAPSITENIRKMRDVTYMAGAQSMQLAVVRLLKAAGENRLLIQVANLPLPGPDGP